MAKFYGSVKGNRGEATRLSNDAFGGITTTNQSYNGSIITNLSYTEGDCLVAKIDIVNGSSNVPDKDSVSFYGTLDDLKNCFETYKKLKMGGLV